MDKSPARDERFRPETRLRKKREFDRIFRAGKRLEMPEFICQFAAGERRHDRLGLSVSRRRIGNAPCRNRAKRIIRELFRRGAWQEEPVADIIVIPKTGFLEADTRQVAKSWRAALSKIKKRLLTADGK